MEEHTLIIRHLPKALSDDDQDSLLQHFGACRVRSMGHFGRMKHVAFATFPSLESAKQAISRLHQVEILGSKLVVEWSKHSYQDDHPSSSQIKKVISKEEEISKTTDTTELKKKEELKLKKKLALDINQIAEQFGLVYPLNPKLKYMYPPPSVTILTNIANALASVPKFYVQVLHLMNKMNLPAPFDAVTATPPLSSELKTMEISEIPKPDNIVQADMEISSSEESEIESEEDLEDAIKKDDKGVSMKRTRKNRPKKERKRAKLQFQTVVAGVKQKGPVQTVEEVFEQPQPQASNKKLEFKLVPAAISNISEGIIYHGQKDKTLQSEADKTMINDKLPTKSCIPSDVLALVENQAEVGGFGKIEPAVPKTQEQDDDQSDEEEWGATEFISTRKLRKGKISSSEMRDSSAFRNYQAGEPTSRLYIKNLARQITEKDLHYVFGKYVDWDNDIDKQKFDIRLMKEGRMKGQAFVTLPNEIIGLEALKDTHGFLMKGSSLRTSKHTYF